ncbi:hypothetical protein K3X13_08845 [Aliiroseovarius crassostreae]|uniref:hypothetical protein n=1 Tax=Aliiroseovarius crassostreae TaxID=154981 RepID=UPI00220F2B40|nr:hypothetical protein [Aliiroseovarius crassostreae]UWP91202.1 hypothetical protein K3X13_08845 [Aliiroseovarius crassostreae]
MEFDWDSHKCIFHPDGSLRDIYVFNTNEDDWDKLLAFAKEEGAVFIVDGDRRPMPDHISMVNFGASAQIVAFRRGALDINCHFFTLDEIEMDIDPKQVSDQSGFDCVLSFLRDLGRALNRNAVLTEESSPQSVWFSYDASHDTLTSSPRKNR